MNSLSDSTFSNFDHRSPPGLFICSRQKLHRLSNCLYLKNVWRDLVVPCNQKQSLSITPPVGSHCLPSAFHFIQSAEQNRGEAYNVRTQGQNTKCQQSTQQIPEAKSRRKIVKFASACGIRSGRNIKSATRAREAIPSFCKHEHCSKTIRLLSTSVCSFVVSFRF